MAIKSLDNLVGYERNSARILVDESLNKHKKRLLSGCCLIFSIPILFIIYIWFSMKLAINLAMTGTKVLVIVGPTASGKSDLAVKHCEEIRWRKINSADSRQVIRS